MIPQEIIDFIHSSHFGYIGSHDKGMAPTVRRCWGTTINDTKEVMIAYVVQAQYEQMLKNFNDNGGVSLTLVELPSFRSYQFKGQFLKARKMTPDEVVFQQQYRGRPLSIIRDDYGYSNGMAQRYVYHADLAIEFRVEKIFNQTPGPGAGKAIELVK